MLATVCEPPSFYLIHERTFPTFGLRYLQCHRKGGYRFSSIWQPRMSRYCDQYYSIATATIFFYDFILTLTDEVSHVICAFVH